MKYPPVSGGVKVYSREARYKDSWRGDAVTKSFAIRIRTSYDFRIAQNTVLAQYLNETMIN